MILKITDGTFVGIRWLIWFTRNPVVCCTYLCENEKANKFVGNLVG